MCNSILTRVLLSRTTYMRPVHIFKFHTERLRDLLKKFRLLPYHYYFIHLFKQVKKISREHTSDWKIQFQPLLTYAHSDKIQNRSKFRCCPKYSGPKIAHNSKLNPGLDFQDFLNYCFQIKLKSRIFNWNQILVMSNFWTTICILDGKTNSFSILNKYFS